MTDSPFIADPLVASAYADRLADGPAIRAAAFADAGNVVSAVRAAEVIEEFSLGTVEALMLHLLDSARVTADPPISGYVVGIVGRERESGDLLLGGNLEFPGTHLGHTVHGEGFVMTRAFQRGTSIDTLALGRAHPCAHCRQYISEFAASSELTLIDTLGHSLSLADIYPWPFAPSALGETGAVGGTVHWPTLTGDGPEDLLDVGRYAWAPYSGCPSAVVLEADDGRRFSGTAVESVAFNPSMLPLESALIALRAHGGEYGSIRRAWLGTVAGGASDPTHATTELLGVVAPEATLTVVPWRP